MLQEESQLRGTSPPSERRDSPAQHQEEEEDDEFAPALDASTQRPAASIAHSSSASSSRISNSWDTSNASSTHSSHRVSSAPQQPDADHFSGEFLALPLYLVSAPLNLSPW